MIIFLRLKNDSRIDEMKNREPVPKHVITGTFLQNEDLITKKIYGPNNQMLNGFKEDVTGGYYVSRTGLC